MGAFGGKLAHLTEEIAAGRAYRKEMRYALKSNIAALRTDVEAMLTEFGKKRVEARRRMQSEMVEFTSRLQRFTKDLSEQVVEMRKGFQRSRTAMLGRFIQGLKSEAMETLSDFEPCAIYESNGNDRDDLTKIPGIGPRRQTLLYQAGIHTFAQLAQSTTDHIGQILGKQTGKANVDEWISRAAAMSR